MTRPVAPATRTRHETSRYMLEYLYAVEARLKRRLLPDEVRSPHYLAGARVYAEAMLANDRQKGQTK